MLNVLSRDLSAVNILFDEKGQVFPEGFHPRHQSCKPDISGLAKARRRRGVRGIGYIIIDFGLSSQFASREERELVVGCISQDKSIPELSYYRPYDPFAVDIYALGNVYRTLVHVRVNTFPRCEGS